MRTAALLAKGVAGDARALPAPAALHMATLAGAKALGLDQEIGSLQAGKAADFIALDLGEASAQPLYHAISQLVYASARHNVTDVFVAGRALLRGRELTTVDEAAAIASAQQWRQKIRP
jgi:5-methylthioadenosine/S-adenosylhomocysteine deaminase